MKNESAFSDLFNELDVESIALDFSKLSGYDCLTIDSLAIKVQTERSASSVKEFIDILAKVTDIDLMNLPLKELTSTIAYICREYADWVKTQLA